MKIKTDDIWIKTEEGNHPIAYVGLPDISPEDARRLVACWNAMQGIDDPALWVEQIRHMDADHTTSLSMIQRLQEGRNELIKALRDVSENRAMRPERYRQIKAIIAEAALAAPTPPVQALCDDDDLREAVEMVILNLDDNGPYSEEFAFAVNRLSAVLRRKP